MSRCCRYQNRAISQVSVGRHKECHDDICAPVGNLFQRTAVCSQFEVEGKQRAERTEKDQRVLENSERLKWIILSINGWNSPQT